MYIPFKKKLKKAYPEGFQKVRRVKDQLVIETQTLRQVGLKRILKQFFHSKEKWRLELPLQAINSISIDVKSLAALCESIVDYKQGGHTYYFSSNNLLGPLAKILKDYPENAGIKILKRCGDSTQSFPTKEASCKTHTLFSPEHKELLLVHNLFYQLGMGPRLYDIKELHFKNGDIHVAYILEHIEGVQPQKEECEHFIEKLKELEEEHKWIKLINWNGYKDLDYVCPSCNGNLIADEKSKSLKYVDLQNFALNNYFDFLKKTATEAAEISHFGYKSYLMGGSYLYQEVPGLNITAKRSPQNRFIELKKLLLEANVSLKDKFVMDIGCNMGLMGAQYLKNGAKWLHGFDMPEVAEQAERILLSTGCTKFSLSGLMLNEDVSLTENLPEFLKNKLDKCVISYLAIHGHIGWIKELGDIPWEFMIYEGHEHKSKEDNLAFIADLNKIKPCKIVSDGWISDANSAPRYIAVIGSVTSDNAM